MTIKIGVIGGSGLYEIDGIQNLTSRTLNTPFGKPSAPYICGALNGVDVAFLPRHGVGHRFLPSEINYRANIFGMKMLGVKQLISVSAVGSLKDYIHPMDMVIPDQFVDRTNGIRKTTFFGDGIVVHVSFGNPICPVMTDVLYKIADKLNISVHKGGTYINIEGPAFSTRAESNLYRSWGMDIIGMTNLTEAKLAREAEMRFATLAMVTDYDCWHATHEEVSVESVLSYLHKNVTNAKRIIKNALPELIEHSDDINQSSIKDSILTHRDAISADTLKKLKILIGDYI